MSEYVPTGRVTKPKGYRALFFDQTTNRLEMDGMFTAEDLRNLADWLDTGQKESLPMSLIPVKLSPIN